MISNLTAIRSVNIAQVVGNYVQLKRNAACCPFHNEKSASFSVNPAKGFYKCFGCGAGGDAIGFVMAMEKCDFLTAAEKVAGYGGISFELDGMDREAYVQKQAKQKGLKETIKWALQLYANQLTHSEVAMQYINDRWLTNDTIDAWQLGYAPDSWDYLTKQIMGKTSPEHAIKLGLVKVKAETNKHYDGFRNRIIFPYLNEYGEPVSLSGRTIAEHSSTNPKSIKGLNTELYTNSDFLFGLWQARPGIERMKYAITVEGEIDVIQMHQQGADNTIGIGKSLLSVEQVRTIARFTKHVVQIPDMDEDKNGKRPGLEAAEKNIPLLLAHGIKAEIFLLPEGDGGKKMDPDDFAKTFIKEPGEESQIETEEHAS